MRKNFGGELRQQPSEIVVLFTISAGGQFEHALAATPQLLGITRRCHFTRLIHHLNHLNKKLTLRRPVPDISPAKSLHDLQSQFPPVSRDGRAAHCNQATTRDERAKTDKGRAMT
jgi:hypothetical protein